MAREGCLAGSLGIIAATATLGLEGFEVKVMGKRLRAVAGAGG
jgi:hypothetical protein